MTYHKTRWYVWFVFVDIVYVGKVYHPLIYVASQQEWKVGVGYFCGYKQNWKLPSMHEKVWDTPTCPCVL